MSCLTEEQRKKIEENRQKALKKRAELLKIRTNDITQAKSISDSTRPNLQTYITPKTQNFSTGTSKCSTLLQTRTNNVKENSCASNAVKTSGCDSVFSGKRIFGSCFLCSNERFTVKIPYHAQTIEVFKTLPSKQYDVNTRQWSFSINDYKNFTSAMSQLKPEVVVNSIPTFVLQALKKNSGYSPIESIDLMGIDHTLLESLMPFQRDGVCFGISRDGRVLIADDMGLGKTIQALGIASYYRSEWPMLIVSPSSVRYAWAEALERWIADVDINVTNTVKDSIFGSVVIVSYDLLSRRAQELKDLKFQVVIMDESHMLKSFKTQRYKAAAPIMKEARRLILLSGTPALSRPSELYTQISSLNTKLMPNFHEYGLRYCSAKQLPWGWDYSGFSNMEELQIVLKTTIMIRRTKAEVMSELPPKQRMTIVLDPSLIQSKSTGLQSAARNLSMRGLKGHEKQGAMLEYFSETAHAKLKAVGNYIKNLLEEEDKKFIVFAHHKVMLKNICGICEEQNTNYICIDGSTTPDARQKLVSLFQVNPDTKVAVLSITAASTGITLTAAQLVVFAELYWNPGYLIQAEDRAHRIGQENFVLVHYLVAKNTADDHIWPLVQNKLNILNQAGFSKENFGNASSSNQQTKINGSILDYFKEFGEETDDAASLSNKRKRSTSDEISEETLP